MIKMITMLVCLALSGASVASSTVDCAANDCVNVTPGQGGNSNVINMPPPSGNVYPSTTQCPTSTTVFKVVEIVPVWDGRVLTMPKVEAFGVVYSDVKLDMPNPVVISVGK